MTTTPPGGGYLVAVCSTIAGVFGIGGPPLAMAIGLAWWSIRSDPDSLAGIIVLPAIAFAAVVGAPLACWVGLRRRSYLYPGATAALQCVLLLASPVVAWWLGLSADWWFWMVVVSVVLHPLVARGVINSIANRIAPPLLAHLDREFPS